MSVIIKGGQGRRLLVHVSNDTYKENNKKKFSSRLDFFFFFWALARHKLINLILIQSIETVSIVFQSKTLFLLCYISIYIFCPVSEKSYLFNDLFSLRSFRGILSKTKLFLSDINPPTFRERFETLKSNLVLRAINGNFRGTNYYIESCNYSQQTRSPYSTLYKRGYTPCSGNTLCSARDA